eukprot:CAMPEP_0170604362 /NCGR_PEP_ID=MMETSP0224-20130122/19382_1 /TAXON_ID=285029 /ORGANISM="Togula jolla, Strain CCCM 725" /LENGTH=462 /DNA_ID=CAMNT_0010929259 /DNA_START=56 /DNA_END=1444 /DNA_ORIENTATION=-
MFHLIVLAGVLQVIAASDAIDGLQLLQLQSHISSQWVEGDDRKLHERGNYSRSDINPHFLMECPNGAILQTRSLSLCTYHEITRQIRQQLINLPTMCMPTFCPQADYAGCALRMAGHDFMDYADGIGGANACTDMTDPDNAGLAACLYAGEYGVSLRDVYVNFCTHVSLADFLVIAAEAVIDWSRRHAVRSDPTISTFHLEWRFRYGRRTAEYCPESKHKLPNPEGSCSEVERVFVQNMGLTWEEAAALMGVHTLGRAKPENSGYDGWWSDPLNGRKFNNYYYISMLANGWMPDRAVQGIEWKNQWLNSNANFEPSKEGPIMMLNTDMCLAFSYDKEGQIDLNAREHDCCTWPEPHPILDAIMEYNDGLYCGVNMSSHPGWETPFIEGDPLSRLRLKDQRAACCQGQVKAHDCGSVMKGTGPAGEAVFRFANDEDYWLSIFSEAWFKATTNGFPDLKPLDQC